MVTLQGDAHWEHWGEQIDDTRLVYRVNVSSRGADSSLCSQLVCVFPPLCLIRPPVPPRTSEGRLHGGLHHAHQQLQALGVLGEAGGERRQGVGMTTQVLQGDPLAEVGLREEEEVGSLDQDESIKTT